MSREWVYPVELRQEGGRIHAYAAALPEAIASGACEAEALTEMRHALTAAVRGRIKDGMDLDPPIRSKAASASRCVSLPAELAAKAAIYAAWKRSGLSRTALAERLGRNESETGRLLDPNRGTRLDDLEEAAAALGGHLRVTFEQA